MIYREIITERLILRPLSLSDLETTYSYASDKENAKYMIYLPNENLEQTRSFLQSVSEQWNSDNQTVYEFAVVFNNKHIGAVSVYTDENGEGELGWIIDRNYQNKGYITEAARAIITFSRNTLKLKKLYAHCDANNIPSSRVMEKLGMTLKSSDGTRQNKLSAKPSRDLMYIMNI